MFYSNFCPIEGGDLTLQCFKMSRSVLLLRMRNWRLSSVVLSPFRIETSREMGVESFDFLSSSTTGGISSVGVDEISAGSGDGETPRSC